MVSPVPYIRPARPDEGAAFTAFARAIFIATYSHAHNAEQMERHVAGAFSEAKQTAELADPARTILVAECEGAWCGFVTLHQGPVPPMVTGRAPIEIERFYVGTEWQGQGLADRLMAAAYDAAATRGNDVVWLNVWRENARAIRYYRKAGFTLVGEVPFRFGGVDEMDFAFARPIPPNSGV